MRKNKKTAAKAVILYIVLTVGMWMFFYSYTNSYNRLTEEKIVPAELNVSESSAELTVIGKRLSISQDIISPESKVYFVVYLFMPIELRNGIRACTQFLENRLFNNYVLYLLGNA